MPEVSCIGVVLFLFLVFLILVVILPSIARSRTRGSRQAVIRQIEGKRGSRVIVMIQRQ